MEYSIHLTYREMVTKQNKVRKQFKRGMISSYEMEERVESIRMQFITSMLLKVNGEG
jgi:hypothetical protein